MTTNNITYRIIVYCPEIKNPAGGVKQLYRLVDILNSLSYQATILHSNRKFKISWFENSTKVSYSEKDYYELLKLPPKPFLLKLKKMIFKYFISKSSEFEITEKDLLVFPEVYSIYLENYKPNNMKLIYNQGCYLTFYKYPILNINKYTPYLDKNILGVIVNSVNSKTYINYIFPKVPIFRIKHGIDTKTFKPNINKQKIIAFMSRKLNGDIREILNIVSQRNILYGWSLVDINEFNHKRVAETLSTASIFLNTVENEGFGLPAIEAMACGCIVIGYTGMGGNEYFDNNFTVKINSRDILKFALELEILIKQLNENFEEKIQIGLEASNYVLRNYSEESEIGDVREIFNRINLILVN